MKNKQFNLILSGGLVQIVRTLPVQTEGGKQLINCADTKGVFRIIFSLINSNDNFSKLEIAQNIEMFPSDSLGSLDDFSYSHLIKLGGNFNE